MSKYIGTKAVNLSTTSADVTGNADIDGDLTVGGNLTVSGTTITVDSATAQTVDLGDDDKIRLGDDDDLQIYHDSATGNSVINESGGGNLTIQGNELRLQTAGGGNYFRGVNSGASSIFYSNSIRLETTTNGVKAHGNVVSEDASGAPELVLKSYPGTQDTIAKIISGRSEFSGTNSFLRLQTNDGTSTETRIDITDGGDISFYDNSGNAKFFWDASAETLGIGTTNPTSKITLGGETIQYATALLVQETGHATSERAGIQTGGWIFGQDQAGDGVKSFFIYDGNTSEQRLLIDTAGSLYHNTTTGYPGAIGNTHGGAYFENGGSDGTSFFINRKTNIPMYVGRNGDGATIRLTRNGASKGEIGITAGDNLYMGSTTSGHSGISFGTNEWTPMSPAGSNADGTVDIGASARRIRKIYTAEGIFLGGTGSSNQLEDYEEGTWNLGTNSDPTGVIAANSYGLYRRVGDLVFVQVVFQVSTNFTNYSISGLPFNPKNENTIVSSVHSMGTVRASNAVVFAQVSNGSNLVTFLDSSGAGYVPTTVRDPFRFGITYRAV
jgi:hypothetical protein